MCRWLHMVACSPVIPPPLPMLALIVIYLPCSYDETILPTDYKSAGQIVDDELNAMLVRPLQPGVVLHALIDACHSGTAMDLPYRAKADGGRFHWKVRWGSSSTYCSCKAEITSIDMLYVVIAIQLWLSCA
eukprot:GHUV01029556.1.p1 GENE.GHUV01029556.1~~GHUV01029556.1.p1  ORF type:complete len:131 (-),score=23.26 GHUV01029556.1:679-1071(-)